MYSLYFWLGLKSFDLYTGIIMHDGAILHSFKHPHAHSCSYNVQQYGSHVSFLYNDNLYRREKYWKQRGQNS